jgi:hypothetical protein
MLFSIGLDSWTYKIEIPIGSSYEGTILHVSAFIILAYTYADDRKNTNTCNLFYQNVQFNFDFGKRFSRRIEGRK